MFKPKICKRCLQEFIPDSRSQVNCDTCRPIVKKEKAKIRRDKYYLKKGCRVGVGSGGLQKERLGELSPSFKTGIGIYREIMDRAGIPMICNRCGKDLDKTKPASWCTHHIDQNRHNNDITNLERMCKRCHQIEHRCWEAIGLEIDDEDIEGIKRLDNGIV